MTGRDLDPYMGRAFLGDGLATIVAGYSGGTGVTTYAENIGVMAVTKIYSTIVFVVAALIAIALGFSPKFGALIQTIPGPVLGGVSIVVFGLIAAAGAKIWVDSRVDFSENRNLDRRRGRRWCWAPATSRSRSAAWRSAASRPRRSARSCSTCCCANDASRSAPRTSAGLQVTNPPERITGRTRNGWPGTPPPVPRTPRSGRVVPPARTLRARSRRSRTRTAQARSAAAASGRPPAVVAPRPVRPAAPVPRPGRRPMSASAACAASADGDRHGAARRTTCRHRRGGSDVRRHGRRSGRRGRHVEQRRRLEAGLLHDGRRRGGDVGGRPGGHLRARVFQCTAARAHRAVDQGDRDQGNDESPDDPEIEADRGIEARATGRHRRIREVGHVRGDRWRRGPPHPPRPQHAATSAIRRAFHEYRSARAAKARGRRIVVTAGRAMHRRMAPGDASQVGASDGLFMTLA